MTEHPQHDEPEHDGDHVDEDDERDLEDAAEGTDEDVEVTDVAIPRDGPRYRGYPDYDEFADWVEPLAERLAGAIYALFEARGRSFAAIEVSIEAEAEHIDGEVMFAMGPDIGFTIDLEWCEARFCELIGDDDEEWLPTPLDGLDEALEDDQGAARAAQRILDGVLAARRELTADE